MRLLIACNRTDGMQHDPRWPVLIFGLCSNFETNPWKLNWIPIIQMDLTREAQWDLNPSSRPNRSVKFLTNNRRWKRFVFNSLHFDLSLLCRWSEIKSGSIIRLNDVIAHLLSLQINAPLIWKTRASNWKYACSAKKCQRLKLLRHLPQNIDKESPTFIHKSSYVCLSTCQI